MNDWSRATVTISSPPAAVRAAAERLIAVLAADEAFGAWLSQTVIDQRVLDGDLIPAERLQFSGGLELVPAGRIHELETAIAGALAHLGTKPDAAAARDALNTVGNAQAPANGSARPAVKAPAKRAKKTAAKKAPARPAKAAEAPSDIEPDGRPTGMPSPNMTYPCEVCSAVVEGNEAQMPWIRFRRILCQEDFRKATA